MFNDTYSTKMLITSEVSQRLILGPALFSRHFNQQQRGGKARGDTLLSLQITPNSLIRAVIQRDQGGLEEKAKSNIKKFSKYTGRGLHLGRSNSST